MGMMGRWVAAWAVGLAALHCVACSSDSSGGSGGGGGGDAQDCWPTNASCYLPNKAGSECLALHDNGVGDKGTYRMSQLEVQKPPMLAGKFLQENVVSKAITLKLPECYQDGYGRFSWLFDVDWAAGVAKTGGGHVTQTPRDGYCWINEMVGGFPSAPMEVELEVGQDGDYRTFRTKNAIPIFNVPIYLDDNETNSILLPLHDVNLLEGKVAPDNNCIGQWDGDGLDVNNNCKPDYLDHDGKVQKMSWLNGAKLTGYITAEEADAVWIPEMKQSLCVALSGDAGTYGEPDAARDGTKCKRDANNDIVAREKADWCAATNDACSPPDADSFRLEGMFAASAVKINDTCP